jgi:hypothetical protein
VEVKSLRLDSNDRAKIQEKVSSSLMGALRDLRKYLNREPIELEDLDPFMPDFGLAVSEIFDEEKEHIIRTIVVSIRNADGRYEERNWRGN